MPQTDKHINFDDLFRYNYRPLCLYALHYLQDVDLAEDIVQESYTIISITTIGEIISFKQINRNLCATIDIFLASINSNTTSQ